MNIVLWILQVLMGLYFTYVGVMHFIVPPNLPPIMSWMYDLPAWLHYLTGVLEILGGLGLILPGILKVQTRLVPLAALGLVIVMLGAVVYHLLRGEAQNITINLVNAAALAFIAYGRWRLHPIPERSKET